MLSYNKKIDVTQEEFNTCQEEIKTAIRQIVDTLKLRLLENFPLTKVDFLVSMKGENLQKQYKFLFRKTTKEETDVVFAELVVDLNVVESSNEKE